MQLGASIRLQLARNSRGLSVRGVAPVNCNVCSTIALKLKFYFVVTLFAHVRVILKPILCIGVHQYLFTHMNVDEDEKLSDSEIVTCK